MVVARPTVSVNASGFESNDNQSRHWVKFHMLGWSMDTKGEFKKCAQPSCCCRMMLVKIPTSLSISSQVNRYLDVWCRRCWLHPRWITDQTHRCLALVGPAHWRHCSGRLDNTGGLVNRYHLMVKVCKPSSYWYHGLRSITKTTWWTYRIMLLSFIMITNAITIDRKSFYGTLGVSGDTHSGQW